jgi:hypothetical protein
MPRMNSSKKDAVIVALVVVCVALAFGLWRQVDARKQAETALATREAQLKKALSAQNRRAPQRDASAQPASRRERRGDASDATSRRPNRASFAALMSNPEFSKAMGLRQRADLDRRYAGLFAQLNLSPAELDTLKTLLVERQSAPMDARLAARDQNLPQEQIAQLAASAIADADQAIENLLGADRFAQFQNYNTSGPQRQVVERAATRLSYIAPMTPDQSAALANALAESGGSRLTPEVVAAVRPVMSAAQIGALEQLRAEDAASETLGRAFQRNGPPAPPEE